MPQVAVRFKASVSALETPVTSMPTEAATITATEPPKSATVETRCEYLIPGGDDHDLVAHRVEQRPRRAIESGAVRAQGDAELRICLFCEQRESNNNHNEGQREPCEEASHNSILLKREHLASRNYRLTNMNSTPIEQYCQYQRYPYQGRGDDMNPAP